METIKRVSSQPQLYRNPLDRFNLATLIFTPTLHVKTDTFAKENENKKDRFRVAQSREVNFICKRVISERVKRSELDQQKG